MSMNSSDVAAPDGSFSATKFIVPNTSGCAGSSAQGAIASIAGGMLDGQPYTASIWLRAAVSGTHIIVGLDDCHSQEFVVGSSWKRYSYSVASYSKCNSDRGLQFLSWDKNATYYAWGAQVEQEPTAGPYVQTDESARSGYGGFATFTTNALAPGNHAITVSYGGNDQSGSSSSVPISLVITTPTQDASILLSASPSPLVYGGTVTINGTMTPSSATGFLSFFVDGNPAGPTGTLANGTYAVSLSGLSVGLHAITASYSGDTNYKPTTTLVALGMRVVQASSISLKSSQSKPAVGDSITFTGSIIPALATGNVHFYADGTLIGTVQINGGVGETTTNGLGIGTRSITVTYDGDDNYAASASAALSQQILPTMPVTRVAGNGNAGMSGDGGPALSAGIDVGAMAMDPNGNVFFVDGVVIREVMASDHSIRRVAGNGSSGVSGYDSSPDGPDALSTPLANPISLAADGDGNIYFTERYGGRTRKVNPNTGSIQTIINRGSGTYSAFLTVDHHNRLIYQSDNCQIVRQYQTTGQIEPIAGTAGACGLSGDGGSALSAQISAASNLTVDPFDNVYFVDGYTLRKIDISNGTISKLAGDGVNHSNWNYAAYNSLSGDGGNATNAPIFPSPSIAIDVQGNVFLGTWQFGIIREIFASSHIIDRIAGKVAQFADDVEGKLAIDTTFAGIGQITTDFSGTVYLAQLNKILRFGNPAQPTHLTWAAPSPISTSTPLSAGQLNASSGGVPGTFTYTPVAGTTLPVGVQTLTVLFQPTDAARYSSSQAAVKIIVNNLVTPTITWAQPVAITYPQDLTAVQLNASSTVPGKFFYTPALHTILNAGTQTLIAQLAPNDTATYNSGFRTTTITVNPGTPIVSWPSPAAISTGTVLSSVQLNATANVPGTFSYSPGAGAVLSAGTNTLSVTFTPSSSNYVSRTITTQISVSNGAPAPVIRAINPDPAMINQQVTIYGSRFGSPVAGSSLKFNGVSASYSAWTDTSITATVPAGAATGNVIVNNGSTSSNPFLLVISGVCQ